MLFRSPNQGLQLLLKYTSGNSLVSGIKGFEAEFRRSETSFHLRKPSAHWSDSAEYFCALSDTVPESARGAEHKLPETLGLFVTQELARVSKRVFFSGKANRAGWAGPWGILISGIVASISVLCHIQIDFMWDGGLLMSFSGGMPPQQFPSPSPHTEENTSESVRVLKSKR